MKNILVLFLALFLTVSIFAENFDENDDSFGDSDSSVNDPGQADSSTQTGSHFEFQLGLNLGFGATSNEELNDYTKSEGENIANNLNTLVSGAGYKTDNTSANVMIPAKISTRLFYKYLGIGIDVGKNFVTSASEVKSDNYSETARYELAFTSTQYSFNLIYNIKPEGSVGLLIGGGVTYYTNNVIESSIDEDFSTITFNGYDASSKGDDELGWQIFGEYQYKMSSVFVFLGIEYRHAEITNFKDDESGIVWQNSNGTDPLVVSLSGTSLYFGVGMSFGNTSSPGDSCCCL